MDGNIPRSGVVCRCGYPWALGEVNCEEYYHGWFWRANRVARNLRTCSLIMLMPHCLSCTQMLMMCRDAQPLRMDDVAHPRSAQHKPILVSCFVLEHFKENDKLFDWVIEALEVRKYPSSQVVSKEEYTGSDVWTHGWPLEQHSVPYLFSSY